MKALDFPTVGETTKVMDLYRQNFDEYGHPRLEYCMRLIGRASVAETEVMQLKLKNMKLQAELAALKGESEWQK